MSSVVLSDHGSARSEQASSSVEITVRSPAHAEDGRTLDSRAYSAYTRTPTDSREPRLRGFVTNRRYQGFITNNTGETWQVTFIEHGQAVPYHMPAKRLRDEGISLLNQPFEMDELVPTQRGLSGKLYRFRPLASAQDAFEDTVPLDAERERKRAFILSQLGESKA